MRQTLACVYYSKCILRFLRNRRDCDNLPNAPLELFSFEHNATAAAGTQNANVSAGSGNGPYIVAAGMLLAKADLHAHDHWDSLRHGYEPLRVKRVVSETLTGWPV